MNSFKIDYNNDTVLVEQLDNTHFTVHLLGGDITLVLKEDNEGACHWFVEGSDNETEETSTIGVAIDTWLTEK
ncbi:hypothetical protein SAMN05518672_10239 [Chitinophaga sp. CF118]|uniref:hypothetical protein n=1 Tax=Chitinophaga sp. CF118 TaxID=1884367 RepID=UPI0008E1F928|nr:hypothetical protein [Chitinophaga sp. CF118]SFD46089.1 hypothetical protein SAMN05518672_10239 [Chitinophaga sp. CF118]